MTFYSKYLEAVNEALRTVEASDQESRTLPIQAAFDQLCQMTGRVRAQKRKQYLCGNGASAAFANHMALDWTKNGGVPTHSFSDSAFLTAISNDMGYDEVFCSPLRWYAEPGDQLVTISTSGESPNIINTIRQARELEMAVITFSGLRPTNLSRQLGDLNFYVPAKSYGIVECAHQVLLHLWLDLFTNTEEWNLETAQNFRRVPSE